jgi:hypothetical protein
MQTLRPATMGSLRWTRSAIRSCSWIRRHMQPRSRLMHLRRVFTSWRYRLTHRTAYVPIYGDGIHGKNPHPGHLIAVFDLVARRHAGDFSTYPYLAPHGLRWGPQGQLYCVCENSGVVLEMNAGTGNIEHVIEVGSDKAPPHRGDARRVEALHRE